MVQEFCKDDDHSQWESAEFDPDKLNTLTNRHQNLDRCLNKQNLEKVFK